MARILIVDDSPSQLMGIRRIVEKLGHEAVTAEDGDWWFAVVCVGGDAPCGSDQTYSVVTAPIWFE